MLQWLLVLVLAFDHLSAPFHRHHHEGAAVQHGLAAAHHPFGADLTHAAGADHPLLSHAGLAIRTEPSHVARLAATPGLDERVALLPSIEAFAALAARAPTRWHPDRSRPIILSHRNLPPAGRGPPSHA